MLKRAIASLSRLHSPHRHLPPHSPSPSPPQTVVREWAAAAAAFSSSSVSTKISPSLLYTEGPSTSSLSLYNLKDRKIHTINTPKPSTCIGAGQGWLILADLHACHLTLFNPTTNQSLPLPKLSTLDNVTPAFDSGGRLTAYQIKLKSAPVVLTVPPISLPLVLMSRALVIASNASNEDLTVFLVRPTPVFGLAFAKPGDTEWTSVDPSDNSMFLDVTLHKNRIFTVMGTDGRVCAWEFGGLFPTKPKLTLCVKDEEKKKAHKFSKTLEKLISHDISFFLVTSPSGDLLRVRKKRVGDDGKLSIKIHKLELDSKLVRVKSLGENALLLGSNSAICIPAVGVPGLKGNHVYSAEKHSPRDWCDVGVYSMEDKSTKPIPLSIPSYPRPAWVMIKLPD